MTREFVTDKEELWHRPVAYGFAVCLIGYLIIPSIESIQVGILVPIFMIPVEWIMRWIDED